MAGILPAWLAKGICVLLAECYFRLDRQRREVVVQNLLPALAGNRAAAEQTAHRLYRNFAIKLVDLWRFESGVPVQDWLTKPSDLEIIQCRLPPRPRHTSSSRCTWATGSMAALLLARDGIQLDGPDPGRAGG